MLTSDQWVCPQTVAVRCLNQRTANADVRRALPSTIRCRVATAVRGAIRPPNSKLVDYFDQNKKSKDCITNLQNVQLGLH
jgi:hypothetical protein